MAAKQNFLFELFLHSFGGNLKEDSDVSTFEPDQLASLSNDYIAIIVCCTIIGVIILAIGTVYGIRHRPGRYWTYDLRKAEQRMEMQVRIF